jgi:hypothetical protein
MTMPLNMHGFMEGVYSTSVSIGYHMCVGLYDIIKYGFEKESNFVCILLSITILASIIDNILVNVYLFEFEQLKQNKQRIQELEKMVYHIENKLDGNTRMVTLHLQRVFEYSKQNSKEVVMS